MTTDKQFKLRAADIQPLVEGYGGCVATDMITIDGHKVGVMYREHPQNEFDSGWRFAAGWESQEYMDETCNHAVYDVNTIANYDADIIPFLDAPVGSAFERDQETGSFVEIDLDLDI